MTIPYCTIPVLRFKGQFENGWIVVTGDAVTATVNWHPAWPERITGWHNGQMFGNIAKHQAVRVRPVMALYRLEMAGFITHVDGQHVYGAQATAAMTVYGPPASPATINAAMAALMAAGLAVFPMP